MRLYELTEQFNALIEMLCDDEEDEQLILDTFEGIEEDFDLKCENYAKIITQLKADAKSIKEEEERLYMRRKSIENRTDRLKEMLTSCMREAGKTKIKTELFSIGIQKNGGKRALIIDDFDAIPKDFLVPQPPLPDNDGIRALLVDKELGWAHLAPQGEFLRIR